MSKTMTELEQQLQEARATYDIAEGAWCDACDDLHNTDEDRICRLWEEVQHAAGRVATLKAAIANAAGKVATLKAAIARLEQP